MPKIPQYDYQVTPYTPNIPEQRVPSAPRQAFGEDVARAEGNFGPQVIDPIAKLFSDRAEQVRRIDQQTYMSNASSIFMRDMNDRMYSTETQEYKENGQKVEKPYGLLNRTMDGAKGSSYELDDWYAQNRDKYLSSMNDPEMRLKMATSMDNEYQNKRQAIFKHEVQQVQNYREDSQKSFIKLQQENFASIQTPDVFSKKITELQELSTSLYKDTMGMDDNSVALNVMDDVEGGVKAYLVSVMQKDPTGALANKVIEEVPLSEDRKNGLRKLVLNQIKDAKEQKKQNMFSSEVSLVQEMISGNKSKDELSMQVGDMMASGEIRPEMGNAIIRAVQKPINVKKTKEVDDDVFVQSMMELYQSSETQDISNTLMDTIDGFNSGTLSQEKMTLLLQTAFQYGDNKIAKQLAHEVVVKSRNAGLNGTDQYAEFFELIGNGQKPEEAYQTVLERNGLGEGVESKKSIFTSSDKVTPPKGRDFGTFLKDYTENLIVPKNIKLGIANFVYSTPQVAGAFLKEYGERPEENPSFWNFLTSNKIDYFLPPEAKKNIKDKAVTVGNKMIEENRQWLVNKGISRPETGAFNQVMFDLGSGAASLGTAVGMTVLTKSPMAATIVFGALQKGQVYQEAREAGLSPEQASKRSNIAGAVEGGLELVGLNFFMRNFGGRIINATMRGVGEGIQEASQTLGEDFVANWRGKSGMQMINDAGYSALLGFVLGGGASTILDSTQVKEARDTMIESGMERDVADSIIINAFNTMQAEVEKAVADIENEMDVQRLDGEGGGQVQTVKSEPIKEELKPLAIEAQKYDTAESFAKAIVPNKEQELARKYMIDFYNRVVGVKEEGSKGGEMSKAEVTPTLEVTGGQVVEQPSKTSVTNEKGQVLNVTGGQVTEGRLKPVGTGKKKVSRLADRIVNTLENIPKSERVNVPEYNEMSNKANIRQAAEFAEETSDQEVLQIFEGKKKLPEGLTYGGLFVAMSEKLKESEDYTLASQLVDVQSKQATRFGQEIEILKEVDVLNPLRYISNLHRAKIETAQGEKKIRKRVAKEAKGIKEEMNKMKPKKGDWIAFIEGIRC